MVGPLVKVFVDGSFEDLTKEMAEYLHVWDDVKPLLDEGKKDDAMKKIIIASPALLSVPEREFTGSYNLLIYLVLQLENKAMFLPRVCDNLMKPITSSPIHGPYLGLLALTTVFNLLDLQDELRFNVFMAIVRYVKLHGMYDNLKRYLGGLPTMVKEWDIDEDDQRELYMAVAEVARDAGDEETSYNHVLTALRTFDKDELKSEEAQQLALRATKTALMSPTHYLFQDLLNIPAINALSDSHPIYYELLTIFLDKDLEDYNDFNEEHEGLIEKEHLDGDRLLRKIRLLSFVSLAVRTSSQEIPYDSIAKVLQIPLEEVEIWTIDVIRAGLVQGKLSQREKVFKVHGKVYRVFTMKQWRELAAKCLTWTEVLRNVQEKLAEGQLELTASKKREIEEIERRMAHVGLVGSAAATSGGGRRGGGDRGERAPRRERTDDED
ncbi:PCI-domain-containing protein [Hypoxylon sp. NC1633]|nr:PCI-domain-containing protein [Hypoxylon sp. NC1633]